MLFGKLDADAVHHVPESPGDADAHARPFGGSRLLGGVLKVLCSQFPGSGFLEQLAARLGERDALPMADEQGKAELILELLNVPAQWGLGDVKAFGGLGHAQGVGDRDERAYVPEVHERRDSIPVRHGPTSKMYWTESMHGRNLKPSERGKVGNEEGP